MSFYPMGGAIVLSSKTNTLLVDLIAHWRLNETTGTTCYDSGPNAINGTINGATINQTGHIGNSYYFNGGSARVSFSGSSLFAVGTGNYSLSAWVKTTTNNTQSIFQLSAYDPGFYVKHSPKLVVHDSSDIGSNKKLDIDDGVWHHVAIVREGTGTGQLKFYLDGTEVGTGTHPDSIGAVTSMTIGNSPYQDEGWEGNLDDIRFYGKALSLSEVQQLAAM